MTRFRALVAEDEPLAREMVAALLRADPDIESVLECGDAASARDGIARLRPDIAFLDIEMPGATGLQVADGLDPRGPVVVFITAFSNYATQAFDVSAVDYVLKPFSDRRFAEAVERAKRRVRERRLGELATQVASISAELHHDDGRSPPLRRRAPRRAAYLERLAFKDGDRSVVVKTDGRGLDRSRGLLRADPCQAGTPPGASVAGIARAAPRSAVASAGCTGPRSSTSTRCGRSAIAAVCASRCRTDRTSPSAARGGRRSSSCSVRAFASGSSQLNQAQPFRSQSLSLPVALRPRRELGVHDRSSIRHARPLQTRWLQRLARPAAPHHARRRSLHAHPRDPHRHSSSSSSSRVPGERRRARRRCSSTWTGWRST